MDLKPAQQPRVQDSRVAVLVYLNLIRDLYEPQPAPKPGIQDSRISVLVL